MASKVEKSAGGKRKPPNAGKGRKKGVPNKSTAACKEALQLAFEGIGGVPALIKWGQDEKNRSDFYKLWVKLMPTEVKNEVSGKLEGGMPVINLTVHRPEDDGA